jgi:hypothetical protein
MFKVKKEGNKLIFQKIPEEENKIPPKENYVKKKESEDENWLEKEDKEVDVILVNKEGLEREQENKEEKEKEKNIPKRKEKKVEELKNSLADTKWLASKLLRLLTTLKTIKKVKALE